MFQKKIDDCKNLKLIDFFFLIYLFLLTGYGFAIERDLHRVATRLVRREACHKALGAQCTHRRRDATTVDQDLQVAGAGT